MKDAPETTPRLRLFSWECRPWTSDDAVMVVIDEHSLSDDGESKLARGISVVFDGHRAQHLARVLLDPLVYSYEGRHRSRTGGAPSRVGVLRVPPLRREVELMLGYQEAQLTAPMTDEQAHALGAAIHKPAVLYGRSFDLRVAEWEYVTKSRAREFPDDDPAYWARILGPRPTR